MILNIFDDFVNFFGFTFNILSSILEYIYHIFNLLFSLLSIIPTMSITFFSSMPSFISMGLLSVFALGISILVIKIYGSIKR